MTTNTMTVTGNLTRDPELRYTPTGQAVASFAVAYTPRYLDKTTNEWTDGDTLFLNCNVWRQAAENVAESLQRGSAVIVTGKLKQRSYETKEGEKRTVYELEVDDIGASLMRASVKITKTSRERADGGSYGADTGQRATAGTTAAGAGDPWAATTPASPQTDEPPF